jgi:hypothetical protein
MFRTVVLPQDAVTAVYLLECSMHSSSLLGLKSLMHSNSPDDPDEEYKRQEVFVLKELGMNIDFNRQYYAHFACIKFIFVALFSRQGLRTFHLMKACLTTARSSLILKVVFTNMVLFP